MNLYEDTEVIEKAKQLVNNLVMTHATSFVHEQQNLFHYVESLKYTADAVGYKVNHRHIDHHLEEFLHEGPEEVYSWWIVDPWFSKRLSEKGEVILYTYMGCIWGRQNAGQAIHIDDIILEIAQDTLRR